MLGLDKEGHIPYVMNHSFSIQHNLGAGTIIDVGYVGSLGRHLMWQRNINSIPFGANFDPRNADPTIARTPLPQAFSMVISATRTSTSASLPVRRTIIRCK